MSAVNISGTFKKDSRPDNGLEAIAGELVKDQLSPRLVVGIVVPHKYEGKPGEELVPTVRIAAIEVVSGDDAVIVRDLLDKIRATRHQQPVQDSLPWGDRDERDDDEADDRRREAFGSDGFAEPEQ